jgi:hypothetical protein
VVIPGESANQVVAVRFRDRKILVRHRVTTMGAGYSDWYEESRVENAEERPAEPPQPIQLALPGVDWQSCLTSSYLLDSY